MGLPRTVPCLRQPAFAHHGIFHTYNKADHGNKIPELLEFIPVYFLIMADADTNETASGRLTAESYFTHSSATGELASASALPDRYHHSFISLFSVAQQLEVDIQEATWQPALGTLGAGASSHISLSNRITSRLAFAFKRRKLTDNSPEAIRKRYRGLICEILILRHPAVREHPNITSLQGIAWEFDQGVAWPVLVFPEASHGSLANFIQGGGGKTASLEELLRICAGCGLGLEALHRNGRSSLTHSNCVPILIRGI
jgi:hypothetical protein